MFTGRIERGDVPDGCGVFPKIVTVGRWFRQQLGHAQRSSRWIPRQSSGTEGATYTSMKKFALLMLAALPLILSSCATPPPPQVFHNTDNTAVVIRTTDNTTGQLLQPTMSMPSAKDLILAKVQTLPQHQ